MAKYSINSGVSENVKMFSCKTVEADRYKIEDGYLKFYETAATSATVVYAIRAEYVHTIEVIEG